MTTTAAACETELVREGIEREREGSTEDRGRLRGESVLERKEKNERERDLHIYLSIFPSNTIYVSIYLSTYIERTRDRASDKERQRYI